MPLTRTRPWAAHVLGSLDERSGLHEAEQAAYNAGYAMCGVTSPGPRVGDASRTTPPVTTKRTALQPWAAVITMEVQSQKDHGIKVTKNLSLNSILSTGSGKRQYDLQIVVPCLDPKEKQARPSDWQHKDFPRQGLYANVVADQLERASKARGRVLCPSQDYIFQASWAGYYRSLLMNINWANQLIRDDAKYTDESPATLPILQLLISDLKAGQGLWKAHLRGFFAYVESRGGVSNVMALPKPEKSRLSPILNFSVNTGMFCPPDQQINGSDAFTDEDIKTLVQFSRMSTEICPAEFMVAKVRTTRLRVSVATGNIQPESVSCMSQVKEIFDMVWLLDIDSWARGLFHDIDDEKIYQARLLAEIFAVATRLYSILTLPRSAVAAWAVSDPDIEGRYPTVAGHGTVDSLRRGHCDELLRMLHERWANLGYQKRLWWPAIVAGFAVAEKTTKEQQYMDDYLVAIWKLPDIAASSIIVVEKLRAFWLSGKTTWDECFDEPLPVSL